jgi:hypothetical protein
MGGSSGREQKQRPTAPVSPSFPGALGVTFRTSGFCGLEEYATQPREILMSAHFTVFGGSFVHEARGFSPAPRRRQALAVWGFVLTSLLLAVTTVASVTASAWAHGAVAY